MKTLIPILIILLAYSSSSQSLFIYDVDTTDFPIMRAKYYATDATGNQIYNLSASDFIITENQEERDVVSITCPNQTKPDAISSVLTIDNSASMNGANIEIAKEAASSWINAMPLGKSECAITAFNNLNQYIQDFTTDGQLLLQQLSGISVYGSTDFDAAFVNPIAGGLLALESAKHKKVMLLLTDGTAEGNENLIISKAQSLNATVFCVTLGYKCPEILKSVAEKTGGMWFENVTTKEQAIKIYNSILSQSQGIDPCIIEWESKLCTSGYNKYKIALPSLNIEATINSWISQDQLSRLKFQPQSVLFLDKEIGKKTDTLITITSQNADFYVTNIISNHTDFDISPKSFYLEKGESIQLQVSLTPTDKSYKYAVFNLENDICDIKYSSFSKHLGQTDSNNITLNLTHPNGGEKFLIGSDTSITWEGIPHTESVSIEYSYDGGNSWLLVDKATNGLSYLWSNIPKPTSNNCKMRIRCKGDNKELSLIDMSGHVDKISSVVWSPDGSKVATASDDKSIRIWDSSKGRVLQTLLGHTGKIKKISWSPDGNKIATSSSDKTAKIWDINTGLLHYELPESTSYINDISWSPDGSKFATAGSDSTARIWEATNGQLIKTLIGHKDLIYGISWSPDGSRVATASRDKKSRVWDATSGNLLHVLSGHEGSVHEISWSPDGSMLATTSDDRSGRIWDANNGNLLHTLTKKYMYIYHISWSPDGTKLASCGAEHRGRIWDVSSGILLLELAGHTSNINHICWSSDGNKVATSSYDQTAKIWDANTGAVLHELSGHTDWVQYISWGPDGSKVATASYDQTAKIWDANTGAELCELTGHTGFVSNIVWSPNGNKVATSGMGNDETSIIWDAKNGQLLTILRGHISGIKNMCWSPDGSKVATASYDKTAKIWEVSTGKVLHELSGHTDWIQHISWSPDGSKIATASYDNTAKIWDANTGKELHQLSGHTRALSNISWNQDGSKLISASYDKTAKIWNANNGLLLLELSGHSGSINNASWSPDGSKVATVSSDKTAKIWDANNGLLLLELSGHSGSVNQICWSPDGNMVATASKDKNGLIWDANSGQILHKLSGHTDGINHICWSPEGNKVATASNDSHAKIWILEDMDLFDQQDTSDAVFSIVAPEISSRDINIGDVVINTSKDSVVIDFIDNIGQWDCRIDTIYFDGADANYFKLNGPRPAYTVAMGYKQMAEFKFSPTAVRDYSAQIVIVSQADTLYQNIYGRGVGPKILVINEIIDFGRVYIDDYRDTIKAVTITNAGSSTVHISKTEHVFPNATDFTTIKGAAPFTLNPGDTCRMDLRFMAHDLGRTTGRLLFHSDAPDSPHPVTLFAEGYAKNTVMVDNIIFSKQAVGTVNDSTVLEYFNNAGMYENKIDTVFLADGDVDQFEIKKLSLPVYLANSEKSDLDITFQPTSIGHKQTKLYMVCQSDTIVKTVEGISTSQSLEMITHNVDFGTIELGQRIDSVNIPILYNSGTEDILISQVVMNGSDIIDFETGSGFNASTLSAGDTMFVDLDFIPQSVGSKHSEIEILHNISANAVTINVTGEAIEALKPHISIIIPHLEARAGQDIEVPIILDNTADLDNLVSTNISVKVKFNSYIMLPTEIKAIFEQNIGFVSVGSIDINKSIGDTLATIYFKILLGNKELSSIEIAEVQAEDTSLAIETESGSLKLIDLCEQGGKRLYNPTGEVGISSLSPNPAEDKLQITVKLIEEGQTKLELYDELGNRVRTIIDETISNPGERHFNENLDNIPSGSYTIILTTPTYRQVEKLIIQK